jgi:ABC-type lipopolysaccharide export system ATPase subunit
LFHFLMFRQITLLRQESNRSGMSVRSRKNFASIQADKLIELIKKHSVNKGIVISDHNYGKVLEVVNRLTLIREGVLLELTDKRGLVEQGYLLSESYL